MSTIKPEHLLLRPELHRILLKRITSALMNAKYTPATVAGDDGPHKVALEVLRPYVWRDKRKWEPQKVAPALLKIQQDTTGGGNSATTTKRGFK